MFGRVGCFLLVRLVDDLIATPPFVVYQLRRHAAGRSEFERVSQASPVVLQRDVAVPRSVDKVCSLMRQGCVSVDSLESLNLRLTSYHVVEILKRSRQTDAAVCFFTWARQKCSGRLGVSAYSKMMKILADAGRFSGAWRLLEDMRNDGRKVANVTFWTLIKAYCKLGRSKEAVEALNRMELYGCKPTTSMCNHVMNVLHHDGLPDVAEKLYEQMWELGCIPDSFTHCIRIDSFTKSGNVDAACKAFQTMKDQGCHPNGVAYTTLLDGLGRAGNWEAASKLFDEMKARGCEANVMSYSALLHALAAAGQSGEAHRIFREMITSGVQPAVFTYTGLVNGLIKADSLHENWPLFHDLVKAGCLSGSESDFDPLVYILISLCKVGKSNVAWTLLKDIKATGRQVNHNSYSIIFHAFLQAEDAKQALAVVEEFTDDGGRPLEAMYNALISCLGKKGHARHASMVLDRMKMNKCAPSVVTYTLLIDVLGRAGARDAVERLLQEMAQQGCHPNNHTYNVMLNNLTRAGNLTEAWKLFRDMQQPDVFSYNIVMNALGKIGKVDAACHLYEQMKTRGCSPDIITYNNLLASLVRAGRKNHALIILDEMRTNGSWPNDITRKILESAHSANQAYGDMLELCKSMQQSATNMNPLNTRGLTAEG